jgi:hypothetical protein
MCRKLSHISDTVYGISIDTDPGRSRPDAGLETAEDFNPMARSAVDWTRRALSPETREYLRELPTGRLLVEK